MILYYGQLSKFLEKRRRYARRSGELGAIKLESDVSGVVDVVVRGSLYGVRDVLVRCSQIYLAVNMEDEVGIR